MKFRAEREKILGLVEHVEGVIERRNTIPILSNILLEVDGDELTVIATDLDITVRESLAGVDVATTGKTTVSAATFSALIRKMPNASNIDIEVKDGRMTIQSGRIRYRIPVISADDYPLGQPTEGETLKFPIEDIIRAFKLVRSSMSTEETRYYLNGAYLAIENGNLIAVSTDGHRLSIAQIVEMDIERPDAIVPRKAVNELIKILGTFEGEVQVRIDQRSIEFEVGDLLFHSKLVDGTYPDYERVLPSDETVKITVDPNLLSEAIERVSVVSMEKTNAIKLMVESDKITIAAQDPNAGSAQEEVAAEANQEITVGYNSRYLRDILACYNDCKSVTISLGNETSPALVRPDNSSINRAIIMPMRV